MDSYPASQQAMSQQAVMERAGAKGMKRVNVNFSPSAYAALQALAADTGKSVSEVLRDAIALSRWFYDVTHEPGTHLLVERDGKTREILPLT